MAKETSGRDPNYVTTLMGLDLSTGLLPTNVYVDETTHRLLVSAVISGNVASGATDSGNPVKVAGVYNTSAPTLTNGQRGDLQLDSVGNVKDTLATLLAGENLTTNRLNVEPIYSFTNITTATTTTPKSGAGTLHAITVNTPVASATITIYDNTSAASTKIGTITLGGTLANDQTAFYLYDVSFNTGLTLVTSGATDITVSWR